MSDILRILYQCENSPRSRAIRVCLFVCTGVIRAHYGSFSEGAKVKRVNDPTFVTLASDEFGESGPNLSYLPHLCLLSFRVIDDMLAQLGARLLEGAAAGCGGENFGDGALSHE